LDNYFEQKEKSNSTIDLSTYMECKKDIGTLLKSLGEVAEYAAITVHAISMVGNETNPWLTILAGAGGAAIAAANAKAKICEMSNLVQSIKDKRTARKFLVELNRFGLY